jgi:rhomboid protease GluP
MKAAGILTVFFLMSAWIGEIVCVKGVRSRRPKLTLVYCALLLACLLAQLIHPELLTWFQRDSTRVVAGEWWRMVSALFFQDGQFWGGITNVLALYWIGSLVERGRSQSFWLVVSMVGAVAAECVGLKWQPIGAGNSVVTCALAGSLILSRAFAGAPFASKISRCAAVSLAVLLTSGRDVHGIAAVTGIILGLMTPTHGSRQELNNPLSNTETL